MNIESIIWLETNAMWLYPIIKEYIAFGEDLGMNYLSLGSLRYDEKYFVGYIYDENNLTLPINLVSYIQYKTSRNKLTINYLETAAKYRQKGVATKMIDAFADKIIIDSSISVDVTRLSYDGKQANLIGKFQNKFSNEVVETSKRNTM